MEHRKYYNFIFKCDLDYPYNICEYSGYNISPELYKEMKRQGFSLPILVGDKYLSYEQCHSKMQENRKIGKLSF